MILPENIHSPVEFVWPVSLFILGLTLVTGCSRSDDIALNPFSSDGCSLFPDRSLISQQDWCECCFEHDLAYWKGGTGEERLLADLELRQCILEKTGDEKLAELMYQGVRFGGSPYFYNWYRWGYGWDFQRKYGPLSEEELALVEMRWREYTASQDPGPCSGAGDESQR